MKTRVDHVAEITITREEIDERMRSMARPLIAKALDMNIEQVTDAMMEINLRVTPSSTGGSPSTFDIYVRARKPTKD